MKKVELFTITGFEINSEILEEANVFDDVYKQPNRKNCALLPSVAIDKLIGEINEREN